MIYRLIPQNYQVTSTTSGRWRRMWSSPTTGRGWLGTGTSGYQSDPFHFASLSTLKTSMIVFFLRFREELETLSNSGINYVRIPVGYWTWQVEPEEPFPTPILDDSDSSGALFYLKRLLVWLDQLGMKANIDLHGAPGSQNGFEIRQKAKLPLDILGLITVGELARRTGWKKVRWIGPRRCWGWSAQRWDM